MDGTSNSSDPGSFEAQDTAERLRAILDAAVDGIVTIDERGTIETVNSAVVRIFGYDRSELVGRNVKILMPEPYRSEHDGYLERYLRTSEPRIIGTGRQVEGRRKDGTTFPLDLSVSEVTAGGRRIFTGIIRDITERRQIEEELRLSEERFSRAFRGSPDALLMTRGNGVILDVNDGFEKIFGYPREEVIGRTTADFDMYVNREDRERALKLILKQGHLTDFEVDMRTRDGEIRHASIASQNITINNEPCFLAIIRDATDRRRAEDALRESEKRYRAIFQLSAVGQAELELPTRHYSAVNRRFCEITGYSEEELLRMTVVDVTHPDDRVYDQERFDQTLTDGQSEHFSEKRYLRKDGTIRWVDVRGRLMTDDDGRPTSLVEIISDITDRRLAEQALRRSERELREINETLEHRVAQRTDELLRTNQTLAQRNRELNDFANVASHDLREPLRKIQTFADLLEGEYGMELGSEGRMYLERMRAVASRMSELLTDLRTFSRITTGTDQFVSVDLNDLLVDVLADLEIRIREAEAEMVVEPLTRVRGIPTHLRQLFQNLIENALKFHRVGVVPRVRVRTEGVANSDMVAIVVEDNGIGFDEIHAERIFGPFQRLHTRTEYEGTGMGLAICRRIAEHHGGTIAAESRDGAGARFRIILPMSAEEAALTPQNGPSEDANGSPNAG